MEFDIEKIQLQHWNYMRKKYYASHTEHLQKAMKDYRAEHLESVKETEKRYRDKHLEERNKYSRNYVISAEKKEQYNKTNRLKYRIK